jgi:hypothetical protein
MPLAAAVADYHNHRVKKLKKQGRRSDSKVQDLPNCKSEHESGSTTRGHHS